MRTHNISRRCILANNIPPLSPRLTSRGLQQRRRLPLTLQPSLLRQQLRSLLPRLCLSRRRMLRQDVLPEIGVMRTHNISRRCILANNIPPLSPRLTSRLRQQLRSLLPRLCLSRRRMLRHPLPLGVRVSQRDNISRRCILANNIPPLSPRLTSRGLQPFQPISFQPSLLRQQLRSLLPRLCLSRRRMLRHPLPLGVRVSLMRTHNISRRCILANNIPPLSPRLTSRGLQPFQQLWVFEERQV
jgi:hypothetical protein